LITLIISIPEKESFVHTPTGSCGASYRETGPKNRVRSESANKSQVVVTSIQKNEVQLEFTSSKCSTRAAVSGDGQLISATASAMHATANGTGPYH
jgi:hypothetical protein